MVSVSVYTFCLFIKGLLPHYKVLAIGGCGEVTGHWLSTVYEIYLTQL